MLVLGIDPGPEEHACVIYDTSEQRVVDHWIGPGTPVDPSLGACVIERPRSYMMQVGQSTFDTCFQAGRIYERLPAGCRHTLDRTRVKLELLGKVSGTDAHIRGKLIDLHGGSRQAAVGKKASPGPLYGVVRDEWAALAVAVAWARIEGHLERA